jgi:hypothetical protein
MDDDSPFIRLMNDSTRIKVFDYMLRKYSSDETVDQIANNIDEDPKDIETACLILSDINILEKTETGFKLNKESEITDYAGSLRTKIVKRSDDIPPSNED